MKIAIIGYGRMGKEIEKAAIARAHEISLIIDINNQQDFTPENLKKADVAIDFTTPDAVAGNILTCFDADIPVVAGTTGWQNELKRVTDICIQKKQALFHASNYSIGVNIMFAVNEYLASLMNRFPQYDVSLEEFHHIHKLDSPSGTAITIADQIISMIDRKKKWELNTASSEEALKIKAVREGEIKGIHEVTYDSDVDYISLKHFAKSRIGFAFGAVQAAEFIVNKRGVFTMRDLMGL